MFTASPLSGTPRTFRFPVADCVPYRGFSWQATGDDVSVGGVSACSALGRLPGPVPSSLPRGGDSAVIRTIVHELARQVVCVPGDTSFDGSFAVAVETAGAVCPGTWPPRPADRVAQARAGAVNALLTTRSELSAVYRAVRSGAARAVGEQISCLVGHRASGGR